MTIPEKFFDCNNSDREHRLLRLAWDNPQQFAIIADEKDLHRSDFADPICGVLTGYLRWCGEQSDHPPGIIEAEAILRYQPFNLRPFTGQVYYMLNVELSPGDTMAGLIDDIRAINDCRFVAKIALHAATQQQPKKSFFQRPRKVTYA